MLFNGTVALARCDKETMVSARRAGNAGLINLSGRSGYILYYKYWRKNMFHFLGKSLICIFEHMLFFLLAP